MLLHPHARGMDSCLRRNEGGAGKRKSEKAKKRKRGKEGKREKKKEGQEKEYLIPAEAGMRVVQG